MVRKTYFRRVFELPTIPWGTNNDLKTHDNDRKEELFDERYYTERFLNGEATGGVSRRSIEAWLTHRTHTSMRTQTGGSGSRPVEKVPWFSRPSWQRTVLIPK